MRMHTQKKRLRRPLESFKQTRSCCSRMRKLMEKSARSRMTQGSSGSKEVWHRLVSRATYNGFRTKSALSYLVIRTCLTCWGSSARTITSFKFSACQASGNQVCWRMSLATWANEMSTRTGFYTSISCTSRLSKSLCKSSTLIWRTLKKISFTKALIKMNFREKSNDWNWRFRDSTGSSCSLWTTLITWSRKTMSNFWPFSLRLHRLRSRYCLLRINLVPRILLKALVSRRSKSWRKMILWTSSWRKFHLETRTRKTSLIMRIFESSMRWLSINMGRMLIFFLSCASRGIPTATSALRITCRSIPSSSSLLEYLWSYQL